MAPCTVARQERLDRLRREFLEMPGLRLTVPQVGRLCGVDRPTSEALLASLVDTNFLVRTSDGSFALAARTIGERQE